MLRPLPIAVKAMLAYCRAGFEEDCAGEYIGSNPNLVLASDPGLVQIKHTHNGQIPFGKSIFARQIIYSFEECSNLPAKDRITPIFEKLLAMPNLPKFSRFFVECADADTVAGLKKFCTQFYQVFERHLKKEPRLALHAESPWRLHLCFLDYERVIIGISDRDNASSSPGGIPRLRSAKDSPSRAGAKLDEAFIMMLSENERGQRLRGGMRAVDLGAAPGGWSSLLANRDIYVTAIDHAKLDPSVANSDFIEHLQVDAFTYQPKQPVDWLVCDVIERPQQVATMIGKWFANQWCKSAIVTLKMPMKDRLPVIKKCLEEIQKPSTQAGLKLRMQCKQLFHNRSEVTVCVLAE